MTDEKINQEDEIDLVELVKNVWARRWFIIMVTIIFGLIGFAIAFTTPTEYEASCKLLPESQENQMPNLGELAGLAGLAGVNLSSMSANSGVMTPQLYPEIAHSLPFIAELMSDTVFFEQLGIKTTPLHYFKEMTKPSLFGYLLKYTLGLPGLIKSAIVGKPEGVKKTIETSEYYRISQEDWDIMESFKKRINVEIDNVSGVIGIMVEMPDPYAAAQMTEKTEQMITEAVVKYKTDKTLVDLAIVEESYKTAKKKFEEVEYKVAWLTDRNRNVSSALAKVEQKRVEYRYDLAFGLYKGLSTQLEQAKMKLKEVTPVFTILEPVRVPERKSKPLNGRILVISCFFGLFISIVVVIGRFLLAFMK